MFPIFHTNAQHRDLNVFTPKNLSMAFNTYRIFVSPDSRKDYKQQQRHLDVEKESNPLQGRQ